MDALVPRALYVAGSLNFARVLCVDEIDNLSERVQRTLFELPRMPGSSLVLIGMLVWRAAPKLQCYANSFGLMHTV